MCPPPLPPEIPLPVSLCLFLTRTIGCCHTFSTELEEFVPITSTTDQLSLKDKIKWFEGSVFALPHFRY